LVDFSIIVLLFGNCYCLLQNDCPPDVAAVDSKQSRVWKLIKPLPLVSVQRHLADSCSEKGSSGCQNVNNDRITGSIIEEFTHLINTLS